MNVDNPITNVFYRLIEKLLEMNDKHHLSLISKVRHLLTESSELMQSQLPVIAKLKDSAQELDLVIKDALQTQAINDERYGEIVYAFSNFSQSVEEVRSAMVMATDSVLINRLEIARTAYDTPVLTDFVEELSLEGLAISASIMESRMSLVLLCQSSRSALKLIRERPDLYSATAWRKLNMGPALVKATNDLQQEYDQASANFRRLIGAIDSIVPN
jgi:hypothetical protein